MKWYRACFEQRNEKEPSPLFIDVLLDDNRMPAKLPYAGWWGIPRSNHWTRPLLFRLDGLVDFGGDPETPDPERFGRMRIHERRFDLAERFFLPDDEDGGESEFELVELKDLIAITTGAT